MSIALATSTGYIQFPSGNTISNQRRQRLLKGRKWLVVWKSGTVKESLGRRSTYESRFVVVSVRVCPEPVRRRRVFGTPGPLLGGGGYASSLCRVIWGNSSAVLYELLHVRVPHPRGCRVLEVGRKVGRVDCTRRSHLLLLLLPQLVHVRESGGVTGVESVRESSCGVHGGDLIGSEGRVRTRVGGSRRVLNVGERRHDSGRAGELSERVVGRVVWGGVWVLLIVGGFVSSLGWGGTASRRPTC
jgi:hypothetical protein